MSNMCQDWVVWLAGSSRGRAQGERRPVGNNNRQIARADNQKGVVRWGQRMRGESKAADRSSKQKPIAWLKELKGIAWATDGSVNRSSVLLRLSLSFPGESDSRVVGDHVRSHQGHPYIERLQTLRYILHLTNSHRLIVWYYMYLLQICFILIFSRCLFWFSL